MKALQFLKSLLPNFSKISVLEDVRITKLVLSTVVVPTYENSMRLFATRKFTNDSLKADWELYRRMVRGANGANTIVAVQKSFGQMSTTLDLIETMVDKIYSDEIEGSGLTYLKTSVLQMLESISFASDYALKYLNYAVVVECAELDSEDDAELADEIGSAIVPAEVRWLKERFQDFCTVMGTLSKPTAAIKDDFDSIPDIVVTEQTDRHVQSTVGAAKLDPFMHGLVPVPMNMIYHARMHWAEYQNARYQQAKAEKDVLELRKLKMERALQGKKDPTLEKQINYTQRRIDELREKIRQEEAKYA